MSLRQFLVIVCLLGAFAPCFAEEKPTVILPLKREGDQFQVWMQSSLERVYPKSPVGKSGTFERVAYRNGRFSFQVVVRNDSTRPYDVVCKVKDAADLQVVARRVGYVPMRWLTTDTPPDELEGHEYLPGYVPDPLLPNTHGSLGPLENLAYWITVIVPENVKPGKRTITLTIEVLGNHSVDVQATIDVRDFTVQKRRDFPVTHWWGPSDIAKLHNVELWSDEWFEIARNYIQNMVDHGNNTILVTNFFSRREVYEKPGQMLIVKRIRGGVEENAVYEFDYSVVRRFVRMAKECGAEYFEWPHLWLYWGLDNPMNVYELTDGKYQLLWPEGSDGFSPMYLNFLKQYLDSLHAFLVEEEILDQSFFHISDEPHLLHIENYRKAHALVKEMAPWMERTLDALSDFEYAGICDIPIPLVASAMPFVENNVYHWVYYCCAPHGRYINRFMDTPLVKIRMSGWLFYKLRAGGFLHWGYNYWHKIEKDVLIDPFLNGCAQCWPSIPYGDPFVVYPGEKGPIDSIRWEIFAESLQDYALLQTAGLSPDDPVLAKLKTYADFPRGEQWIDHAIETILQRKSSQP
ncbi:MAG: DUF4091 domain-containing protein [Planctomycetaceae bacterium]|nr:DUF4091 domain-containing protein [Planctomycetaceae bacterium]